MGIVRGIIALLLFWACGSGDSGLKNTVGPKNKNKELLTVCADADLHINVLDKNNFKKIFECFELDANHSEITNLIFNIDQSLFDSVWAPANKAFFSSSQGRKKLVGLIQNELGRTGKDEIGKLLSSSTEFARKFKLFKHLSEQLKTNQGFLPNKKTVSAVANFYKAEPESFQASGTKLGDFLNNYKSQSKAEFYKVMGHHLFSSNLGESLSRFWKSAPVGLNDKSIYDLLFYISKLDESFFKNLNSVRTTIDTDVGNCSGSGIYKIDQTIELSEQMENLASGDLIRFLDGLNRLNFKFSLYQTVCGQNSYNQKIERLLRKATEFFSMNGAFKVSYSILSAIEIDKRTLPFSLIDFMNSDFMKSTSMLLAGIREAGKLQELSKVLEELFSHSNFLRSREMADGNKFIFGDSDLLNLLRKLNEEEGFFEFFLRHIVLGKSYPFSANFLMNIQKAYPDLMLNIQKSFESDMLVQEYFLEIQKFINTEAGSLALQKFLDSNELGDILNLILKDEATKDADGDEDLASTLKVPSDYVSPVLSTKVKKCLESIRRSSFAQSKVPNMVENFVNECSSGLDTNMSVMFFSWANNLDKILMEKKGVRFSTDYGLISNELMSFYLTTVLVMEKSYDGEKSFAKAALELADSVLLNKRFIDLFQSAVGWLGEYEVFQSILSKGFDYLLENKGHNYELGLANLFKEQDGGEIDLILDVKREVYEHFPRRGVVETRLLAPLLIEVVELLKDNKAYRPFGDIGYKSSIKDALMFLYESSAPSTEKSVSKYLKDKDEVQISMLLSERFEATISEISFSNNFYGTYFINELAQAKKYKSKVSSLGNYIKFLRLSGAVFRVTDFLPKESRYAFKNIDQTYDSLSEIATVAGNNFVPFVHGFLNSVRASSIEEVNDFSAFKRPDQNKSKGHTSRVLTWLAERAIFSKLGLILRRNFPDIKKIVTTDEFKQLQKGINLFSVRELETELNTLFGNPELPKLINKMDGKWEEILTSSNLHSLYRILKGFLSLELEDQRSALKILNKIISKQEILKLDTFESLEVISKLTSSVAPLNGILYSLEQEILGLLENDDLLLKIVSKFENIGTPSINSDYLYTVFSDPAFSLDPVIAALGKMKKQTGSYRYVFDVLSLLSEEGSLLKLADDILVMRREETESFLKEILSKFSLTNQ